MMIPKPVTPAMHGIIDHVFSGVLLAGPTALNLNDNAAKTFGTLGAGFLAVNAVTNTPAGIKPVLSFKQHQKADIVFLSGMALLTAVNFIRKDRKALIFHMGFLAAAVAHYLLTDYDAVLRENSLYESQSL
jgi:hypothetical protein